MGEITRAATAHPSGKCREEGDLKFPEFSGLELGKWKRLCFSGTGLLIPIPVISKILYRFALISLALFLGLELIMWLFVRLPVDPLKRIQLSNELPGLKKDVALTVDKDLARYLDDTSGPKKNGNVRILCIGGGATFGMFQNAGDTWWGQLGRQLQARGLPVQVAAWGQDRMGIVASTPVAAALMENWKPDVVIANFGFDDVVGQPVEYTYQPEKARSLAGPPKPKGWKQLLLKVSQSARLFRWFTRQQEQAGIQNTVGRTDYWKQHLDEIRKQVNGLAAQTPPVREAAQDPKLEFLDGWKVMLELCQRNGATLIMTGEASLHDSTNNLTQQESLLALVPLKSGGKSESVRPDPAWVERELDRYAEAAEAFATTAKLPWVNLNGRVPRDTANFFSDVIFTDAGAAAAARELLPVVEPVVRALKK